MRQLKKLLIEQREALDKELAQQNPPDLGVFVEETVKTTDKFG